MSATHEPTVTLTLAEVRVLKFIFVTLVPEPYEFGEMMAGAIFVRNAGRGPAAVVAESDAFESLMMKLGSVKTGTDTCQPESAT